VLSDEAVERYLAAVRAHVDPDPAFRRRLRGVVLNQYVAAREAGRAGLVPRAMGRLGRSVLYASFALGVSVTGVMAASEIAVPGDVLYPLKRAIEDLRVEVLPEQFENELVLYELNERFSELVVLVERDDEARIETLAAELAADYGAVLAEAGPDGEPLDRRDHALASLMAQLPDEARVAIARAITAPSAFGDPVNLADPADPADRGTSSGEEPAPNPELGAGNAGGSGGQGASGGEGDGGGAGTDQGGSSGGNGNGSGDGPATAAGAGNGNSGGAGDDPDEVDEPTSTPEPTTEPSPTPKPKKSPKP